MSPWQQQALAHWDMINRMAGRRFQQAVLAEEAALFVMDGLARDDWQRLQAFTGRATLATYVGALTLRLLEDFARIRFGRVKPPLWIQRLGGIWLTLFRLLCLERFSPDEAVAIIGNRHPGQERVRRLQGLADVRDVRDAGSRLGNGDGDRRPERVLQGGEEEHVEEHSTS